MGGYREESVKLRSAGNVGVYCCSVVPELQ